MASLAEHCEIVVGRTPSRDEPSYWGRGASWLSITDMNQGGIIRRTKEQITAVAAASGKLIEEETVLLSFKLSIGKVAIAGIPLYTNEAIAALPIKDPGRLEPTYLAQALKAMDLSTGANRAAMGATLNKEKLCQLEIPLPPLVEQRRVATILDRADQLRDMRRKATARVSETARSIFLDMFSSFNGRTATVDEIALQTKGSIRTGPFGSQLLHSEFAWGEGGSFQRQSTKLYAAIPCGPEMFCSASWEPAGAALWSPTMSAPRSTQNTSAQSRSTPMLLCLSLSGRPSSGTPCQDNT
jgi:hypothetical protein